MCLQDLPNILQTLDQVQHNDTCYGYTHILCACALQNAEGLHNCNCALNPLWRLRFKKQHATHLEASRWNSSWSFWLLCTILNLASDSKRAERIS